MVRTARAAGAPAARGAWACNQDAEAKPTAAVGGRCERYIDFAQTR